MNLIFAIGARYLRLKLVSNQQQYDIFAEDYDDSVYVSRAVHLLGLNEAVILTTTPDLSLVQVCFTRISAVTI